MFNLGFSPHPTSLSLRCKVTKSLQKDAQSMQKKLPKPAKKLLQPAKNFKKVTQTLDKLILYRKIIGKAVHDI